MFYDSKNKEKLKQRIISKFWNKNEMVICEFIKLTWSVHQYQIDEGVCPNRKPSQGISSSVIPCKISKKVRTYEC